MFSKLSILALAAGAVASPYYGVPSGAVSSAAPSQSYACNPAHEYPEGRKCVSQSGGLTLLPPTATASATTTTYACNPAHAYPSGISCATVSGSLTLVTASATPSAAVSCQDQFDQCRQPKNGVSANQSFCAAQNAECKSKCAKSFDDCRATKNGVSANQSFCAAQNAACLGSDDDVVVTQIVPVYTTYCPSATTFTHDQKTYTVTAATTITISSCSGGCKVTTPVKSLPPATTITAVVPYTTTDCPNPTTITVQSSTYTVSTSTVITVPCQGGCTITTPVSLLPPPPTTAPVVVPSTPATTVATPPAPTKSQPAVYTGAAEKVAGNAALALGALGLFFL